MSHHAGALLQAIVDDPDSDELRLIYADWLEEQGDALAEFVRLQVQLDRPCFFRGKAWPNSPPTRCCRQSCLKCANYGDLIGRERHLLSEHRASWLAKLLPGKPWMMLDSPVATATRLFSQCGEMEIKVEFRRGFVERVRCDWKVWQQCAATLYGATPLREVELTTWPDIQVAVNKHGELEFSLPGEPAGKISQPDLPCNFHALMAVRWSGVKFIQPPGSWEPPELWNTFRQFRRQPQLSVEQWLARRANPSSRNRGAT